MNKLPLQVDKLPDGSWVVGELDEDYKFKVLLKCESMDSALAAANEIELLTAKVEIE